MAATLTFTNDGTHATVTGYSAIGDGIIAIPADDGSGHNVTEIGSNAFSSDSGVVGVDFTSATNLSAVRSSAFADCANLGEPSIFLAV